MKLYIKITPSIVEAKTKADLLAKITRSKSFNYYSLYGECWTELFKGSGVTAFNLEKRRRKTARFLNKKGELKTVVVKEPKWIAHVYVFPFDLLKSTKIKIKQSARTFKLIK